MYANNGGWAVAVSLDIRNAFNSLPWPRIRETLINWNVPSYLLRIIDDYLDERWIKYPCEDGTWRSTKVTRGVPQGSVLGPLLWNLTYNQVLETNTPDDVRVFCYADDTLIIGGADTKHLATAYAKRGTDVIIRRIESIGLCVAAEKTEMVVFHKRRRKKANDHPVKIIIKDKIIIEQPSIKYLGLHIDGRWTFRTHFEKTAVRAKIIAMSLGRIMPNLKGASSKRRKLYALVVLSILLYGAPVWADVLENKKYMRVPYAKVIRFVALRVIAGYRTISYQAAHILARIPPIEYLAWKYKTIYEQTKLLKQDGQVPTTREKKEIKKYMEETMYNRWKNNIQEPNLPGKRTREAILPNFESWIERQHGYMTFRLTQLLTGHGTFQEFIYKIGKDDSPVCIHCAETVD
ncbi:reverse transcriptase, partial [Lasius niger]